MKLVDLQVEFRQTKNHTYSVDFLYKSASSEADVRPLGGVTSLNPLELLQEARLSTDTTTYGRMLTERLFHDAPVREAFLVARQNAKSEDAPLRIRLLMHSVASELHAVRWETLGDPSDTSKPLCADPGVFLSRYSLTQDYRPVHLRFEHQLQALVMVANPTNLDPAQVAPIDVRREVEVAMKGLGPIYTRVIPDPYSDQRATLENLTIQLQENRYDIVYLVCHGKKLKGKSWLYLEDDNGQLQLVEGSTLEAELNKLQDKTPILLVLASCQSATEDEGQVLTAIGPRLAQAGVPAVIAMQDKISMETNAKFIAVFFAALQRHGIVDQAMAEARSSTSRQQDFWMPVLFTRLRKGRIWSGFTDQGAFDKWPILTAAIEEKTLVPILGPGLVEPIIGSLREIACEWAQDKEHPFPMFNYQQDSLPEVAQFWADKFGLDHAKGKLVKTLRDNFREKRRNDLDPQLLEDEASLDEIISRLAAIRRQRLPWDAHNVLAKLRLPIYVTANATRELESALEEQQLAPYELLSPWNDYVRDIMTDYDHKRPVKIDWKSPLVFHPFGRLDDRDTVVLTEDEYFQYLIAMGSNSNIQLLPLELPAKLVRGTLLFLGFHLVDWNLRVLLQMLYSFEGNAILRSKKHIAVIQVDSEGLQDMAGARDYLRERLRNWSIYMYVGTPEDFVNELLYYLPEALGGRQP